MPPKKAEAKKGDNRPHTPSAIKRKSSEIGTPSISQALQGNFKEEEETKVTVPEKYAQTTRESNHHFTDDELKQVWAEFAQRYSDQSHLHDALSVSPQLLDNYVIKMSVTNSVQLDRVKLLKPELIGFLRTELKNSQIDVKIVMNKNLQQNKLLTDEQKLQAMMKKNPALKKMKQMFNLDF